MEVGEEADDGVGGVAVEVARRLVGEDDRRVADEGAGDGHPLALAAGERPGTVHRPRRETDRLERVGRPGQAAPAGDARVQQPVGDVLQRAQPLDEVELLEHEADAAAAHGGEAAVAEAADVDAVDADRAARRLLQRADDVHQRRLAGPGRTDDDDELALLDAQVDAVERRDRRGARVVLRDAVQLEHAARGGRRRRSSASSVGHADTTWSPAAMSPVTSTMPSANTPSSTPTRWVTPSPSATSSA